MTSFPVLQKLRRFHAARWSPFFSISYSFRVINDVIMSDADCTPGREPLSVAASSKDTLGKREQHSDYDEKRALEK